VIHVTSAWVADWPVPTENGSLPAEQKLVEKDNGCFE